MGSLSNPKTWIPYMDSKDCSQGFCSLYCPQWCYIIFPPPPPIQFPDQNSTPTFSPLVIAIIAILASAFLLLSYYTIISKYCGNRDSSPRSPNLGPNSGFSDGHNPSVNEPWDAAAAGGLDESLIKSITVCKYKKGDGLVEGTDCSVCLSEFEEDESLRLLPKCSHAFHLQCIDTWLKSHSNCPLCRANIASVSTSQSQPPPPPTETDLINESPPQIQPRNENVAGIAEDLETGGGEVEMAQNHAIPKNPFRTFSDLGDSEERDAVIEIRDEALQPIRRSFSMDFSLQEREFPGVAGPSKQPPAEDEVRKSVGSHRKGVLNSVTGAVAMKRSFSSGRLMMFMGHGRVRNAFIPV